MITFRQGDLLEDDAEVLVNTVNTVGAMGAGIALQFKNKYPLNFLRYQQCCRNGSLGAANILKHKEGGKVIYNLATKRDWRNPTRVSWLMIGAKELAKAIRQDKIKSIAIPAIGCNNGGANWMQVKNILMESLQGLDCDIRIYLPQEVEL